MNIPAFLTLWEASQILKSGGLAIYPTETYYALGCLATSEKAANAVLDIKKRPSGKTLSILAGSFSLAAAAVDLSAAPEELLGHWPGPLTLVLPARKCLAPQVRDESGKTAIRVTSHPVAAALSRLCGAPLIATSANISGRAPSPHLQALDAELLASFSASVLPHVVLRDEKEQGNVSMPSTIVEPMPCGGGQWQVKIIRNGAIDKNTLGNKNLYLE